MEGVMRKGAWTKEEDSILTHHVTIQGQGHWNSLALSAGLKRSGKSCRLRWMNYLRPDVKRGNISLHEQFLILHLHSLFGNRWSKIAQYLLGRTDNDIKNYWRTRVQKQAKQLNCDVNSQQFRDAMRNFLIPRLAEQIHQSSSSFSQDEYIVPPNASNNINLLESVVEPSNTTTSSNSSTVPDHQAAHSMPIINHEQVFRNSNSSASNKLDGLQAMDPQSPKRDVAHDDPSSSGFVYVQHSLVASDTYWSNWSGNIEEEIFLNIWADDLNFN